jgi:hypothetical protein
MLMHPLIWLYNLSRLWKPYYVRVVGLKGGKELLVYKYVSFMLQVSIYMQILSSFVGLLELTCDVKRNNIFITYPV